MSGPDSRPGRRRWPFAALALLYLLHNDVWLWHEPRLLWGAVPAGLAWHVGYCLAAAALMALLVRHAWPLDPAGAGERTGPGT